MRLNRLIGIIATLQQKGKVTAPYLAEKFEVSRRTINRDIEDICRAGIPIITTQGVGGGISIMDGFSIDTTVFTEEELQSVFTGLKSLDSVLGTSKSKLIRNKLGGTVTVADDMIIDLSSFYKDSLSEKIELLKAAIADRVTVRFHYYYNKGEDEKLIEPALIIFKWSDWYVFGFCPARDDFRMYKLNRLWDLQLTDKHFSPHAIPEEKLDFGQVFTDEVFVAAVYEPSEKFRLVEEYGPYSFKELDDGRLYCEWGFCSHDNAMRWFLSFGSKVKILSPDDFKEEFEKEIEKILQMYK